MNIDKDKLILKIKGISNCSTDTAERIINNCEIKVDCNECSHNGNKNICGFCINSEFAHDNFNQKQNELDNLFIGAPVMVDSIASGDPILYNYDDKDNRFKDNNLRLPTFEELIDNGWVNKWFAPWLEMSKESKELRKVHALYRYGDNFIYDSSSDYCGPEWSSVDALMILEDLKK